MVKKRKYEFGEEQLAEIHAARKGNKDKNIEKRLKALELRAKGKSAKEIAEATGYHPAYVSALVSKYMQGGLERVVGNHYHGNRRNMSVEKEAEILAAFVEKAEKGQVVEVKEIAVAYEEALGRPVSTSQLYYVLHRHGWRKIMPRSKHPKSASPEAVEASKKLTMKSESK